MQLLDQVVRGNLVGAKVRSIDGHREVGYDQAADRRQGQCVVHTGGADVVVNYVVQWRDRDKGRFEVGIVPGNKTANDGDTENRGDKLNQ